VKVWISPD